MSRIGRKPIELPDGVQVKLENGTITVKGPKGELTRKLHPEINVTINDKEILVERPSDQKEHRALHGTTRSIINNMVEGVTKGMKKDWSSWVSDTVPQKVAINWC